MRLQLTGIIPPLVTPFTGGDQDLDEPALRAEIRYLLDVGVHGLTLCGSTGEGHTLSLEETVRCAEIGAEEARGRVPRSEERRVGKECGSRGGRGRWKKHRGQSTAG